MERTVSVECPRCNYVRYDVLHLDCEYGAGLLIRDRYGNVNCKLCDSNMNKSRLHCPNCGYVRFADLTESYIRIVRLDIYETYIIEV